MKRKWLILAIIVPLTLVIDQVAKLWVVNNLELYDTRLILPVLHPYLQITRTFNTGIAFGIGAGGSMIYLALSILIVAGLAWFYNQSEDETFLHYLSIAMVIGGALGNIIDRARLGHVIDFVHVYIPNLVSNVSNFADHFIVVGVGLMLLDTFINDGKRKEKEQALAQAQAQQAQRDDVIIVTGGINDQD